MVRAHSLTRLVGFGLWVAALFGPAMTPGPARADEQGNVEHAEGPGAHGDAHGHGVTVEDVTHPIEFWGAVVNFGLLVLLAVWFGRRPVRAFLAKRRQGIAEDLAEAQKLKAEATARHREYMERLEHLDHEIERVRQEVVEAGEKERKRILAEAEIKAARMRKEADFLVEQRVRQVRIDLKREAAEAAIAAAQQLLQDKVSDADQRRLAHQYLHHLKLNTGGPATEAPGSPRESGAPADRREMSARAGGDQ